MFKPNHMYNFTFLMMYSMFLSINQVEKSLDNISSDGAGTCFSSRTVASTITSTSSYSFSTCSISWHVAVKKKSVIFLEPATSRNVTIFFACVTISRNPKCPLL